MNCLKVKNGDTGGVLMRCDSYEIAAREAKRQAVRLAPAVIVITSGHQLLDEDTEMVLETLRVQR